MSTERAEPTYLLDLASDQQLMAAAVQNELAWLQRRTAAAAGSAGADESIHWFIAESPSPAATIMITPEGTTEPDAALDRVLQICRDAGVRHLTAIAVDEADVNRMGPRLGARGLRWGGRPHWMSLDLTAGTVPPASDEFGRDLQLVTDPGLWHIPELPLFHPDTGPVRAAMASSDPQSVQHMIILQDGAPVGQSTMNITSGDLGVCGLYETEILQTARTRGLGLNRFDFIRRCALDLGCRYVITNAAETVDTFYRLLGFRSLGHGQGWGMAGEQLQSKPPPELIALAEAIGFGDVQTLRRLSARIGAGALTRVLANGSTPLQFAASNGAAETADWLVRHGAEVDVLSLWALGRPDDVHDFLEQNPERLNERRPRSGRTLLHWAVQRDDAALVEVLLAHGADPTIRDARYDATAEQWAVELRHHRIRRLLQAGRAREAGTP